MSKKRRKSTSTQVSPHLNLVITKYATEHGLTKAEAADRIFSVLYPEGVNGEKLAPIAPGEAAAGVEKVAEIPEVVIPDEVQESLTQTAQNLGTIKTIRALEQDLKPPNTIAGIPTEELMEIRKLRLLGLGEQGNPERIDLRGTLESFQTNILAQTKSMLAETETQRAKQESDFYRKKLEERDAAEQRVAEIAVAMGPIQEQVGALGRDLSALGKKLEPESTTPPTSAELTAITSLGKDIKDALVALKKTEGGAGGEKLSEYLDGLISVMDKVNEFAKKGETTPGEFDWRTAGISTFGEVTTEAIKAYRDIAKGKGEGSEEGGEERPLSRAIIERRVYNYAMKKIAAGELTIDPYKAGEELGLTSNQVWGAVDALRKRGALQSTGRQKNVQEETGTDEEIEEGEIKPPGET